MADTVNWVRVEGVHDAEFVQGVGEWFDLHPLVLEDVLYTGHHPKLEELDGEVFFILRLVGYQDGALAHEQVCVVCGGLTMC